MAKIEKTGRPAIYPAPAALISAYDENNKPNAMTAAWASNICYQPPTVVVGINSKRYTFELIEKTQCFVVNLPAVDKVLETDYCGVVSGRDHDKFEETGFTAIKGSKVNAPIIKECPVNIECKLLKQVHIGSHDAFFGEVVAVHYDEEMMNEKDVPDTLQGNLLAYGTGSYYSLKEEVGRHSFSKKKMK